MLALSLVLFFKNVMNELNEIRLMVFRIRGIFFLFEFGHNGFENGHLETNKS